MKQAAVALCVAVGLLGAADRVDPGTLTGKVLFGYQGWFDCPNSWSHWARGVPRAESLVIDMYPDLREFDRSDLCEVPGMKVGDQPAYLFSAKHAQVVMRHFEWMRDYGLDGVLVQRFIGETARKRAEGDTVLRNVMAAAAATGRVFAIEYDISGGREEMLAAQLREDWMYLVDTVKVTSHPSYLRHDGRPVMGLWGMGLSDGKHPPAKAADAAAIVRWFQSEAEPKYRVTYVGGTPSRWRTLTADAAADEGWRAVYGMMDVVQPWTVGRYRNAAQADAWRENQIAPDLAELKRLGRLYMPVIFPGFSWHNLNRDATENQIPRLRGEFLWRQARNAMAAGATMMKIAMFDEVNESTAMFKVAAKRSDAPGGGYWLTLDADGFDLPSDWYLRLSGEITRAMHVGTPLPERIPDHPGGR